MTLAQVIAVCACAIMMLPYCMSLLIEWSDQRDLKRAKPAGEIPAEYRPVDWEEFEEAVQAHLEAADDPLDPIDDSLVDQLLWRAERGMKLVSRKEQDELAARKNKPVYIDPIDFYNDGHSIDEVAAVYGIPAAKLVVEGITEDMRNNDYREWQLLQLNGWSVAQIAADYGVGILTVNKALAYAREHREQKRHSQESFCVDQRSGKIVAYNTSTEKTYIQDRIGGWST